jgi:hypothetical protein
VQIRLSGKKDKIETSSNVDGDNNFEIINPIKLDVLAQMKFDKSKSPSNLENASNWSSVH